MHTLWTRINNVFFYGVTALFVLSVASAITTLWMPSEFSVETLRVSTLQQFKPQALDMRNGRITKLDRVLVAFDLDADLSGLFNWNVKQLLVYLTATFETKTNELNRVVVWDRVVGRREDARLHARGNFSKYPILDQKAELRGRLLNLTLEWDVMPYTGLMIVGRGGRYAARLPEAYCEGDAAACAFGEVLEETPAAAAPSPDAAAAGAHAAAA